MTKDLKLIVELNSLLNETQTELAKATDEKEKAMHSVSTV
jgi:hypothetical protein